MYFSNQFAKYQISFGPIFFFASCPFCLTISLQEQISAKFTKPISQYISLSKFTIWSVKYNLNRLRNWNFENLHRLSISTIDPNFKIIALVNLEIFSPPSTQDASPLKNRKMHEVLRDQKNFSGCGDIRVMEVQDIDQLWTIIEDGWNESVIYNHVKTIAKTHETWIKNLWLN